MRDMKDVYVMGEKLKKGLCDEGYERCLCDGREIKNVYVMGEKLKKGLCDEGYERCLCDGREGVPITNLPPPKRVFFPTPPSLENRKRVFTSNLQTR